jgi:hypothetical protein
MGCIQIETDFKNLITALQSREWDLTAEGVIYHEIRSLVQLNFIAVEFLFYPKGYNKLAHDFAAYGARQTDPQLRWLEDVPDDVCVRVASELAMSV